MDRKNTIPAILLLLIFLPSAADSSTVARSFSNMTPNTGENITVNLSVSITGGETFYAIDDAYPAGWTITSTKGDTNQSGHVKFVVIQGATNTNHSYTIRTPAASGNYAFYGIYMFEGMANEANVSGQSQVQVTSGGCVNSTFFRDFDNDGYGNASSSLQNCTAPAGYVSSGNDCNDGNQSVHPGAVDACGNGIDEDCSGSDAACQPSQPPGGGGPPAPACASGQTRNCSLYHKGNCGLGTETCIGGSWTGCPGPSTELCNKIDDDCDGQADEGLSCECYEGQTRPCGSNLGECRNGTRLCIGGKWDFECTGETKPSEEVCNEKDDNCDGTVDENCIADVSIICGEGAIEETCKCGDKVYAQGFCYTGRYSDKEQMRVEFPWITITILGVIVIIVLTMLIIYKEFYKKGKKEITWGELTEKYKDGFSRQTKREYAGTKEPKDTQQMPAGLDKKTYDSAIAFIREARSKGLSEMYIRESLLQSGLKSEAIDEMLRNCPKKD